MRSRHLLILAAAVAAAALVTGCNKPKSGSGTAGPALAGPALASVNGDKLTGQELDSLSPEGFQVTRENLPKILDKWVSNTLMYQEALRRGVDKEPQVQAHLKRLERDYLVNELLDRMTSSIKVGQDQLMQYFNQHKEEFSYEVKITRIVMADSMQAVQTAAELKAGADFQKLAKERSQDALLEAGQESRYFARNVGDPRNGGDPGIVEAIFALSPGQVSGVVPSQEGYQIIKLIDKKKVKADVTIADVKDDIEAILSYRRSQAMVDSVLTALRATAKVELKPDAYFEPAGK
jgi:parvulin-like peptidyl-prolyl isomerase